MPSSSALANRSSISWWMDTCDMLSGPSTSDMTSSSVDLPLWPSPRNMTIFSRFTWLPTSAVETTSMTVSRSARSGITSARNRSNPSALAPGSYSALSCTRERWSGSCGANCMPSSLSRPLRRLTTPGTASNRSRSTTVVARIVLRISVRMWVVQFSTCPSASIFTSTSPWFRYTPLSQYRTASVSHRVANLWSASIRRA